MSEAPPSTPRRGLLLALILVPLVALMAVFGFVLAEQSGNVDGRHPSGVELRD